MMKITNPFILLIIGGLLFIHAPLFAAIPPQVTLDMNLQILATHLKRQEYEAAAKIYATTDKLIAEHRLKVEHGYYYYRAETMLNTDQIDQAYESLEHYLKLTGTSGRYYNKALQVLAAVEKAKKKRDTTERRTKAEREKIEKQRKARELKAKEERERAEKQRKARELKAKEERERAEKERKAAERRIKEERRKAERIMKKTGIEFVYIEGGCFKMGSPEDEQDRDPDEGPQHKVCVDDFWMSKYEVTNRQFRRFDSGHNTRKYRGQRLNANNQPAVYMNWDEARNYTSWISRESGMKIRLPTEAEWEYAARGGTTTARFWGDDPDSACRYANVGDLTAQRKWPDWNVHNCDDGYIVTAPVGSFKPNPFGLYDMQGNVWEWCGDWYDEDYYSSSPDNNPQGVPSGSDRVFRGGSWHSRPGVVRVAYRYGDSRDTRKNDLGFRLVLPSGQ